MASLKLSVSLDNNAYESKKRRCALTSVAFTSCTLFPGYVNRSGAPIGKSFCELKQLRVRKLESECLDPADSKSDCVQKDNGRKNRMGDDRNLILERSDFRSREGRTSIWRRFRSVKTVRKTVKPKNEQKSSIGEEKRVLNGEISLDFQDVATETSIKQCNLILEQLEKSSDSKALRFFEWMKLHGKLKNNSIAYNLILRVLGRKGDWDQAEAVIYHMLTDSGCVVNHQVFNTLIYACYKNGLVDAGAQRFRTMLDHKIQPNVATFGMLLSLYQKGRAVDEAEFAFNKMRDLKIVCHSAYSAMITIYTRLGLYDKAEDVIGFLRKDGVVLNKENWLVLLNAYCQRGNLGEAEKVLCAMKEAGFSLHMVAYNTMITGYGRASMMDNADKLFQSLRGLGLEPDETTYRSMVEGWGRAGNYKQAKYYYMELKRSGFKPNPSNMYTMVKLQAKHEDEEGAVRTISDMLLVGCPKSSILGIVLRAYEKANRLNKIQSILEGPLYDHVLKNPTTCTILVTAYVKHCLVDDALKVLREKLWEDPVFEDNLYHLLICSCKDSGHLEDAVKIFTSMPNTATPNLNIFCTMIDIYSKMNLFPEAENLYTELKTSGVELDMIAFSIIVRMYAKSGSLKEACFVLDIMQAQKNIVPDFYLLCDMLRIYQLCGMHDKLATMYYEVLKNGEIWDAEMYNCVINCCAQALPVDELSRLFDEMICRGFAPNTITINVMLNAYGKSRLFERAKKVFWMAKKWGLIDVVSYNTIIAAYGKNKYLKNMSATIRKMQFDGFSVSLEAYNCMLDVYGKEGEMDKFRSVLQRMKASNCGSDHYTYNILINIYGEQGWIDEVGHVLEELKESGIGPNLCSYNTLIKAYGIAGMMEDAVALIKEMRQNGIEPDRKTYTNLITALKNNDMFLEAVKWSLWMKQLGL
ncbi:pentatricopeptide repeat-containing protein At4g30825, chloroplastic [Andrographis paniculata]|uniref:pentatricopeptide repeat-containing protein At4g30825, chloroplastic n=1 Tax=Andrographis paniculata TaxID=175694 RepID=UPI0021E772CD|nr:pentatricopeptide repeat-containing protein At4g30825, chloroplastic [Andrographis paniculata]XP_051131866.1 pentatricopeptide repeat-containing protein At4g30825, chloroplastic [Andrographis paniculata]